jgi:hypothetical protein
MARARFVAIRSILLALCALAIVPRPASAQNPCSCPKGSNNDVTHAGQDYLVVFNQNEDKKYTRASYPMLYIAALKDSAIVTLRCRDYFLWEKTFKLGPREALSYRLDRTNDPRLDTAQVDASEYVSKLVFRVTSTAPIVVYGMNHKEFSADAFMALPRHVAGLEYIVMSYHNAAVESVDPRPSQFAVAAFQEKTNVTITPTYKTRGGKLPGFPFTISLDSGMVYQVQASLDHKGDLTGTTVRADKPVVVFGSHMRAEVPAGYEHPDHSAITSRNHLTEQLPPTSTWGKHHIAKSFDQSDSGDVIRVLAMDDNTVVQINGQLWKTLSKNGYADMSLQGVAAIESSKPVLVAEFAHSSKTHFGDADPFMAIIPPLDQGHEEYTFFNPVDTAYHLQRLIVVTERNGVGEIKLDGVTIAASEFKPVAISMNGRNYSVADIAISQGRHDIQGLRSGQDGFTILTYGVGIADSYGYAAGALFKPLSGIREWTDITDAPIGPAPRNQLHVHNTIQEIVYLDSAIIETASGDREVLTLKERIWEDVSKISPNQSFMFHIEPLVSIDTAVPATLTIYNSTYKWGALNPLKVDFVFHPAQASVKVGEEQENIVRISGRQLQCLRQDVEQLQIVDMLGRIVSKLDDVGSSTIDLTSLASGAYLIVAQTQRGTLQQRIVLE